MSLPESPYELVLFLLEKKNLTLTPKNLIEILRDFWVAIEEQKIPTEIVGDFLIAFSKLLLLKIDYLLGILEEKPEILLDLEKYRLLQKAKRKLRKIARSGPVYWPRKFFLFYGFAPPKGLTLTDLKSGLRKIFLEKELAEKEEIIIKRTSLEEAYQILADILAKEKELTLQEKFFAKDLLIALFLAMLNWFKEGKLMIEQKETFGKIKIKIIEDYGKD